MTLERFRAAHLSEIDLQPAQTDTARDWDYACSLERMGPAWTVRAPDGSIAICAGFSDTGLAPDYSVAWALLSVHAREHMRTLTKMVRRALSTAARTRIATAVECGFAAGERWLRILGFAAVNGPDGRPCTVTDADHRVYYIYERRR